ncbi:FdhD protein [Breoghania corrubedonensis]|uniref:Sulfur carrier protein FdhD n=1 Tax=Breoghania corrubedonensis TaxID=665038 RepID=A0A2T5V7T2_9HYPH|nr:formate dehydrogenase accessory sulfurtransferase FdhD [Breoghania corrubedonensis]PTW59800.1 FdhD protein [Breoghania corrubedonensis]
MSNADTSCSLEPEPIPAPASEFHTVSWNRPPTPSGLRAVPEETAVALTYNGTTHAVMMATPTDLEDYAVGFSLTEGQIERAEQIRSIDIAAFATGIDVRIWLDAETADNFRDRRRRIVGPTGCGLCGIESLVEAVPAPRAVADETRFGASAILKAQAQMFDAQTLHAITSAVHAAAWWTAEEGLVAVREDVGRHNALDKLTGALARRTSTSGPKDRSGILLLTSRISVEMVQKAAVLGAPVIVAVSAPTALAVRVAAGAGITLAATARNDAFDVYTHPERIVME